MPPARTGVDRRPAEPAGELSLAEHVCLVLVVQGVSHGWALGTILGPEGELGRIWSLSRPLTYRAVDGLVEKGFVTRRRAATGQGRDRLVLAATGSGRRVARAWLDAPIRHLRDVRTELLVKLRLRERAGLPNDALVAAQQAAFKPAIDRLTTAPVHGDLVALWRRESARAVRRFLDDARHPDAPNTAARPEMRLSARNQVRCTVTEVHHGDVMSTIKAVLSDGQPLTAAITKDAAQELDFVPGDAAVVVVKSTEVILAKA